MHNFEDSLQKWNLLTAIKVASSQNFNSNLQKKMLPNHQPEHLLFIVDIAQDSDLAPFFEDLSQTFLRLSHL